MLPNSLAFSIFKLELQSFNPFWNAGVTNEGGVGNFTPKLVAMVTSLDWSEKVSDL